VQNAVIGNDNSLLGGMVGAVTLVAVNVGVNRLTAISPTAERLFEGRATTIIDGGASSIHDCAASACGEASSNTRCGCKTVMPSVKSTMAGSNPAGSWC
jgi:hypothetical protein